MLNMKNKKNHSYSKNKTQFIFNKKKIYKKFINNCFSNFNFCLFFVWF